MVHSSLCSQFGEILGAESKYEKGVCMVEIERTFNVQLMGRNSSSVKGSEVLFESLDEKGNALNLSETVME